MSRSPARPTATASTQPVWPVSGSPTGRAGGGVPHPHRRVLAAGDDDVAVAGPPDRHRRHLPVWPVSGSPTGCAGDGVPHPHRPVLAAGDDDVAAAGPADRHRRCTEPV